MDGYPTRGGPGAATIPGRNNRESIQKHQGSRLKLEMAGSHRTRSGEAFECLIRCFVSLALPSSKFLLFLVGETFQSPTLKLGTVGGRRTRYMRRRDKTSKLLETVSRLFLPPSYGPTSGAGILASARVREDTCAFAAWRQMSVNRRWPLGACGRRTPAADCLPPAACCWPLPFPRLPHVARSSWQTIDRQLTDN